MLVIVPATPDGLHPSVIPAILRSGWRPLVVPMHHETSYADLFAELWAQAADFAIVEHDIEVRDDVLASFDTCSSPWCAFSYEVFSGDLATAYGGAWGLGCVRFRRVLMTTFPDVPARAREMDIHPVHRPGSYATLDSTVTQWLKGPYAQQVHQHHPGVAHHHAYNRVGAYWPSGFVGGVDR